MVIQLQNFGISPTILISLHHLPILFLHIEHLYKVGDGNLLG